MIKGVMTIPSRGGFTLVEIMIVVAIVAIALSIAVPNYLTVSKVSRKTVCINNIKKIQAAVDEYAMERNIDSGIGLTPQQEEDIYANYLRGGEPTCPSGGEYIIETIGSNPQVRCTREDEGHILE
ncbi:MAG: prepilin-type N-terminal cleavage/methylation domain-containing protein [Candidatus Omnitrophota bacterium]|nr:prepilin-type N-terminal cleavage/methylation domain-containing protein [Candidatus Omnitrophota bacterium]